MEESFLANISNLGSQDVTLTLHLTRKMCDFCNEVGKWSQLSSNANSFPKKLCIFRQASNFPEPCYFSLSKVEQDKR